MKIFRTKQKQLRQEYIIEHLTPEVIRIIGVSPRHESMAKGVKEIGKSHIIKSITPITYGQWELSYTGELLIIVEPRE